MIQKKDEYETVNVVVSRARLTNIFNSFIQAGRMDVFLQVF
jgi:hypothetical protein